MSIVRQAARCFTNQEVFKTLNAFVGPTKDVSSKVEEANARHGSGQS